jgi:hypothetical protein
MPNGFVQLHNIGSNYLFFVKQKQRFNYTMDFYEFGHLSMEKWITKRNLLDALKWD